MRLFSFLFVAVALMLAALPVAASAQESGEIIPNPEECQVEPRSLEELTAIAATPSAGDDELTASPTPFVMPEGEEADDETVEAITATLREIVACFNAGDTLRVLSLYSDRLVHESIGGAEITQENFDAISTPTPVEEADWTRIIEIQQVLVLPDGRVAALVVGDDPTTEDPANATLFTLVEVEGRWLVDDFVNTEEEATPTP